jgi:hypothetical protein
MLNPVHLVLAVLTDGFGYDQLLDLTLSKVGVGLQEGILQFAFFLHAIDVKGSTPPLVEGVAEVVLGLEATSLWNSKFLFLLIHNAIKNYNLLY